MNRFEKAAAFGAMMGKRAADGIGTGVSPAPAVGIDESTQKSRNREKSFNAAHEEMIDRQFGDRPDTLHPGDPTGLHPLSLDLNPALPHAINYMQLMRKNPTLGGNGTPGSVPKNSPKGLALRAFDEATGDRRHPDAAATSQHWPSYAEQRGGSGGSGPFHPGPSIQQYLPPYVDGVMSNGQYSPETIKHWGLDRVPFKYPENNHGWIPPKPNPILKDED